MFLLIARLQRSTLNKIFARVNIYLLLSSLRIFYITIFLLYGLILLIVFDACIKFEYKIFI